MWGDWEKNRLARSTVLLGADWDHSFGDPYLRLLHRSTPVTRLGPTIAGWVRAVQALPLLVLNPALTPGAWCYGAPLWGNPWIMAGGYCGGPRLEDLPECAGLYSRQTRLRTLGDLLLFWATLSGITPGILFDTHAHYVAAAEDFLGPERTGVWNHNESSGMPDLETALPKVAALIGRIRPDWKGAAAAVLHSDIHLAVPAPKPSMADGAAVILANLGWRDRHKFHPPADYTVKWGRNRIHEISDVGKEQRRRMAEFAALALPPAAAGAPPTAPPDDSALRQRTRNFFSLCLNLPWGSNHREILRRLVHNAVPVSARMTGRSARPCACGHELPDRAHCFWDCSCTQPIRDLITEVLQAAAPAGSTVSLQRHHIWLADRPLPRLHHGVWAVACLCALNAMDSVRRTVTRLSITHAPDGGRLPAPCRHSICRQATNAGLAAFRKLLANFVSQKRRDSWCAGLSETHPFVASQSQYPFIAVRLTNVSFE